MHVEKGFTLIEMLIVVAIIGILSAIAYPSYVDYIVRARRTDAINQLQASAQYLERNMTANNCYNRVTPLDCAQQSGAELTLPPGYVHSPAGSAIPVYKISFLKGPERSSYTLQAVPEGKQTQDPCGTLTLDNIGVRGAASGVNVKSCWTGGRGN